jgi:excisionase family DNA binding protein
MSESRRGKTGQRAAEPKSHHRRTSQPNGKSGSDFHEIRDESIRRIVREEVAASARLVAEPESELLTFREVAALCKVSRVTVRRWIKRGWLSFETGLRKYGNHQRIDRRIFQTRFPTWQFDLFPAGDGPKATREENVVDLQAGVETLIKKSERKHRNKLSQRERAHHISKASRGS